ARQMLARGDFITPYLNGIPFLNKPPLTAWLVAGLLQFFARPEWVRLVSVVAAGVSIVATSRLAARLYGEAHGLLAGLLLATTGGVVLEARTLRPDGLLVASMAVALLCLWHVEHTARRRTRWLVGFYLALAVGMLVKGLLPVVLLAPPVAAVMLGGHGWAGI